MWFDTAIDIPSRYFLYCLLFRSIELKTSAFHMARMMIRVIRMIVWMIARMITGSILRWSHVEWIYQVRTCRLYMIIWCIIFLWFLRYDGIAFLALRVRRMRVKRKLRRLSWIEIVRSWSLFSYNLAQVKRYVDSMGVSKSIDESSNWRERHMMQSKLLKYYRSF